MIVLSPRNRLLPLAFISAAALSAFIAGEGSGIVCGAAAEVAHAGTVAIAQHGGIEVRARRSARSREASRPRAASARWRPSHARAHANA